MYILIYQENHNIINTCMQKDMDGNIHGNDNKAKWVYLGVRISVEFGIVVMWIGERVNLLWRQVNFFF